MDEIEGQCNWTKFSLKVPIERIFILSKMNELLKEFLGLCYFAGEAMPSLNFLI